jgi:hypothetical protein
LQPEGRPASLQKYQRYFKGGYDGYGLNTRFKDTAPRLIIQYACEKMTKENKSKYRRVNK